MRRVLSFLFVMILAIVFGYWLGRTDVLAGTQIGDGLSFIVDKVPVPDDSGEGSIEESEPSTNSESEPDVSGDAASDVPDSSEVNFQAVEDRIFELLNDLRLENGLAELTPNQQLRKAAYQRAIETEEAFSHTRPDGTEMSTILQEPAYEYRYLLAGENLGMGTNYLDEEGMAELLFEGWTESPGHYENMVREDFEEVGIGVHYDGEMLYAVQLFGTPM